MSATAELTTELQKLVLRLESDLRVRVEEEPGVRGRWVAEHTEAQARKRTASAWMVWRDDRITQSAVAWVLATVFIRFCEDNGLVEPVWIAGPISRRQEALDARDAFFRQHPMDTDREWLWSAMSYLRGLRATAALVDEHSALHLVSPSGRMATEILEFWWRRGDDGLLAHDFRDESLSTRFLGDLYQDLSEHAKAIYALLQTPVFVEEFILDRTLEPALADRPLKEFKMIDPACGSGHFLLGAFVRLLDRWHHIAPGLELQARVQTALDAIHGVDLNPFAAAIARFRLTVAALQACGLRSLESAPAFRFHVAVGDSLLHGARELDLGLEDAALSGFAYSTEDLPELRRILRPDTYDAVVGNPPYITVKDKALNDAYRRRYSACSGKYAMTVPFMQCMFDLAKPGNGDQPAGWVGQIMSNSFMKREFGAKLIEEFLAEKDLRLVADTSGAYIPGHGTPTVIVVGRNQPPSSGTVRAVLGVRGEPGRPEDPAKGVVWRSIVDHVDNPGWDDSWVTVADLGRASLSNHPWSLSGGGATPLLVAIDRASQRRVADLLEGRIGFASFPGADECFAAPREALIRKGIEAPLIRLLITGDVVRDWQIEAVDSAFVPYDQSAHLIPMDRNAPWSRRQWPYRAVLERTTGFGGETKAAAGAPWWGWYRWIAERYRTPLSIAFAEVATHNHFVLDRGGKVFKQTAPVIKLPIGETEDNHLALVGILNSSVACFWLKQKTYPKGGDLGWHNRYAFNGMNVQQYPLPSALPTQKGRTLDGLAQELALLTPDAVVAAGVPTRDRLDNSRAAYDRVRARMVAQQEELDWEIYRLYGLIDDDVTYSGDDLPAMALGERSFEIVLARAMAAGEVDTAWFDRHDSTPITDIPAHWPAAYRDMVQRRLEAIASNPSIRLLEKPEYKRRWAGEPWEKREETELRGWLLDRLEERRFWFDAQGRPQPRSVSQLADEVARYPDLVTVLALWEGRPDVPVSRSLARLLEDEAVPFLAAHRYKDSGLRKREAWDETWMLQRREDAGEVVNTISIPPRYTSADFRRTSYWHLRGKLDVPKERFILYTSSGRDADPTALLGWAGWDHAQQSLALALIMAARESEGWPDERLVPLVAGIAELQPWLEQWYAAVDPTYGVSLAAFCREELMKRAAQVGRTLPQLQNWRPAPAPARHTREVEQAES